MENGLSCFPGGWLPVCMIFALLFLFSHMLKFEGIVTFHGPPDMFLSSSRVIYSRLVTNKFSV